MIKNKLVVTEKGKLLCQAVESQHLLTSAEMTAKWETYLKKIGVLIVHYLKILYNRN